MSARRTIVLILEMRQNAHVTEAMATGSEKSILHNLHANRTEQVPVQAHILGLVQYRKRRRLVGVGRRRGDQGAAD